MSSVPNGQKIRSLATQTALMEAAEKLIAQNGIHNVSIKDIVREAGQKNESALQYHFNNLQGLVNAIHQRRTEQTQAKRAQMLEEMEASKSRLTLRDLCELMVYPTFLLAKADPQFRRYAAAFSHEIVLADDSALTRVSKSGGGGESGAQLGKLLRKARRTRLQGSYGSGGTHVQRSGGQPYATEKSDERAGSRFLYQQSD